MLRAAVVMIVIVVACVGDAHDRTNGAGTRSTAVTSTSGRWCWDSAEVRALQCSRHTARRSGDTLYVRLANGRDLPFIDDRTGEAPGGYHYIGRIPRPPLHAIQEYGHESSPFWLFLNERTGRTVRASDEPVISPDSARFATAAQPDWDNCSERDQPSLDVWRFTDTLPVLEWRLDPWDCHRQTGWGPTDPHWHGPDTLEFVRNQLVRHTAPNAPPIVEWRASRATAVHDRNGWRMIAK